MTQQEVESAIGGQARGGTFMGAASRNFGGVCKELGISSTGPNVQNLAFKGQGGAGRLK